ncbi:MAG: queF [Bacteroidetes bacterium]|jgi:7-carboxy-7-deazaguanine synthase (Cx14CxxC type)|nr:queF [Bacteroidota bacterium]
MGYSIKELFYTLQGEGANSGRPAVFCRFEGCNLWSGREEDRAAAVCKICDTDFFGTDGPGGGRFETPLALAAAARALWPESAGRYAHAFLVCTGGEPLLQLDEPLVLAFRAAGFEVAVETNGTKLPPRGLSWVCVSPKAGTELLVKSGDELKLVYPQPGAEPELYEGLRFHHFSLQPMDGAEREKNTELCLQYCLEHPRWRLSLQTHKILGIR